MIKENKMNIEMRWDKLVVPAETCSERNLLIELDCSRPSEREREKKTSGQSSIGD